MILVRGMRECFGKDGFPLVDLTQRIKHLVSACGLAASGFASQTLKVVTHIDT